jgi:hypothetical protein
MEEKEPESSTEPSSDDEKEELKGQCHKICVKRYFLNDRLLLGLSKAGVYFWDVLAATQKYSKVKGEIAKYVVVL